MDTPAQVASTAVRPRAVVAGLVVVVVLLGAAYGSHARDESGLRRAWRFQPTADSHVVQIAPTTTHPASAVLRVDAAPTEMRAYLAFDTHDVGGRVTRALLHLRPTTTNVDGVEVRAIDDDARWDERTLAWDSAPPVGAPVARTGPTDPSRESVVDVTALVTGSPGARVQLVLTSTGPTQVGVASRESRTPPVLEVAAAGGRAARDETRLAPSAPRSAAPTGARVLVAAAGDIACAPGAPRTASACHELETARLLQQADPDVVLPLGDDQYEAAALSDFQASYDASWGRLKSRTRPAVGNHEYLDPGANGYFRYFGAAAGRPDQGWYSFDVGVWHVVALNSNCAMVGGCQAGSPQERWLRADLAASTRGCTLAYWHHPRHSSGQHGGDPAYEPFWRALSEHGTELVLSGHDHDYERLAPAGPDGVRDDDGIRSFVVGTGGKNHRSTGPPVALSEVVDDRTFGVLLLRLAADSYSWEFVPEVGGTFHDSGSGTCHPAP